MVLLYGMLIVGDFVGFFFFLSPLMNTPTLKAYGIQISCIRFKPRCFGC